MSATGFIFDDLEHDGRTYKYATYVPRAYAPTSSSPLVVFLHGAGECGTDGSLQLAVGLPPRLLRSPETWPFIVICPQKPSVDDQWEDHADAVGAMMDAAIERYAVDTSRVYLTGLSQGGHGTWTLNARLARFAAIAPICGYADLPRGERGQGWTWTEDEASPMSRSIIDGATNVPVWVFHGRADRVVPAGQSEMLARAITQAGGNVKLTLYDGVGHNSWDRAYAEELAAWFLGHARP